MTNRYCVYYWNNGRKYYTDGTFSFGVKYSTAKELAKDNASSMPNVYFFIELWTLDDVKNPVYSVCNIASNLIETE